MTQKLSERAHKNKIEYIKNHKSKIIECECGSKTSYGHLSRHNLTKKHLNYIMQISES
jgi:hypothetical protein